MNAKDNTNLIRTFYRMTERLDKIRGQSFYGTFPEVHELLQMRDAWWFTQSR
jgi:hypothetical protein